MHIIPSFLGVPAVLALLLSIPVAAAEAPTAFKVGEFSFPRPAGWEWVDNVSAMRKATLKIPGADKKESAEVGFFHSETGMGGVQANVDRWFGQFQEPKDKLGAKTETATINKRKVTFVQAEGTFLSGAPFGPKTPMPGHMLLGAIVESDGGDVFIKLTGPAALAKSSQSAFRKMIDGALGVK